jgi:hypothetical protein
MSRPLLPEKQRNTPKIKQVSPMKVKDEENPADAQEHALALSQKEDVIDLTAIQI